MPWRAQRERRSDANGAGSVYAELIAGRATTVTSGRTGTAKVGVLFVHSATQPPLGADTWVHSQIVRALDKSRVDVHVACAFGPPDAPTPTFAVMRPIAGIHLVPIDLGSERSTFTRAARLRAVLAALPAVSSIVRLARYIRRHQIAVIHTSDRPRDAAVAVVLARLGGARCIIHSHVAFDAGWMSGMLQRAIRRADAVIAISEFVGSSVRAAGIDSSRVHVVANAIDTAAWTPQLGRDERRAEFGFTPDNTVILSVSRLFPAKGPGDLIRAFALVHEVRPGARLVIVGREVEPGYAAQLKLLAVDLGVDESAVFTGQRGDVPSLMAAADIYAMPSQFEPFGLVYLEAMAMQLPIVALDNGGTPEVVEAGTVGLLSPAGDLRSLVDDMLTLIDNPLLRHEMGRRGRELAESRFTVERLARGCEDVYRLLACGTHGRIRGGHGRGEGPFA
jgi:glycosyltransferase involved in cell wall biosynthesis